MSLVTSEYFTLRLIYYRTHIGLLEELIAIRRDELKQWEDEVETERIFAELEDKNGFKNEPQRPTKTVIIVHQ